MTLQPAELAAEDPEVILEALGASQCRLHLKQDLSLGRCLIAQHKAAQALCPEARQFLFPKTHGISLINLTGPMLWQISGTEDFQQTH